MENCCAPSFFFFNIFFPESSAFKAHLVFFAWLSLEFPNFEVLQCPIPALWHTGRIPCPAQESQDVAETRSEIFTPNPSKLMDSSQKLTQHNPWKDSPLWAPKVVTPRGKSLEI